MAKHRLLEPLTLGRVVGDVVDTFTPSVTMKVTYSSGRLQVCNGHEYLPSSLSYKPRVEVGGEDMRHFFTLVSVSRVAKNTSLFGVLVLHHDRFILISFLFLISCMLCLLKVMVDPDSPSPSEPYLGEHLHWIVINIPGTTDAFFGTEVVSYEMPTPSIGVHRYVFVLFKQKERRPVVSPPASRDCFNTKWFAEEHSLGLPVAAVYFYARRERISKRSRH
ncbi:unnamed protein product [Victoria cruziana]